MSYLLNHLLTRSASRFPDNPAVQFNGQALTYRQFDDLSSHFAAALIAHGIRKGDRVGLYHPKSLEAVVAVFGALKAGAVYVPLDPLAPPKRIAYIVQNCGVKALLTDSNLLSRLALELAQLASLEFFIFTDESSPDSDLPSIAWPQLPQYSLDSANLPSVIEDDLAYILYTSGSTGEPKGVMISHRASLTFINWTFERFQVQPTDCLSNHAPLHFDLSIFDIFVAIKAGARVILIPPEASVFPVTLAKLIEEQHITIWYSVPSLLTRLVLHGGLEQRNFSSLRLMLFAGEVFPIKYLRRLVELVPQAEYYNLYGPTETNVCTYYKVRSADLAPDRHEPVPIGVACENTDVFAVNDSSKRAAQGEVGLLYVRGPGLAKGYWADPGRTHQGFVPHPLAGPFSEIVYSTGDLVRQAPDGNYLFLGRRDHQVKSRGYRIELGEIETALYSHPQVEEAVVIPVPDDEIGNMLRAVVVPRSGQELSTADLAGHCAVRLPKYMLPTSYEFRQTLPKTSTGKIDRALLLRQSLENPVE